MSEGISDAQVANVANVVNPNEDSKAVDEKEVKEIITPDLDMLLDDSNVREKELQLSNGLLIRTPVFIFSGHTVWGATAMILSEFRSVVFEMGI